jgi:hypothetical protein
MRVALYGKETVERHIHRKKEGVSQAERSVRKCCRRAGPDPASTWMIRLVPRVRQVAVHAGWAGLGAAGRAAPRDCETPAAPRSTGIADRMDRMMRTQERAARFQNRTARDRGGAQAT